MLCGSIILMLSRIANNARSIPAIVNMIDETD
jgi:hypothetical protein